MKFYLKLVCGFLLFQRTMSIVFTLVLPVKKNIFLIDASQMYGEKSQ